MAADPVIDEAKRKFAAELAAVAGADAARRLQPALDALVTTLPAETALRERNRMLEVLLDSIPDFVMLNQLDTTAVIFANRAVAEAIRHFSGLPRQEICGKTLAELNYPQVIVRSTQINFPRIAAGETLRYEIFLPMAEGGRWRETVLSPVRNAAGVVEACAVSSRDIHERKLAERRLRILAKLTALTDAFNKEGVFAAMARMTVPELGDWCLIDAGGDGHWRRVKATHRDPALAPLAEELVSTPLSPGYQRSLTQLVAGGSFQLPRVSAAGLAAHGDHEELAALLARLEARSLLVVPLVLRDKLAAVVSFVWSGESPWQHGDDERAIAEAIIRRATQAIESQHLHQQLRQSEERFRVALAHSKVSLFEIDRELRFRWVHTPVTLQLPPAIGRTIAEVAGQSHFAAIVRRVIDNGRGETAEVSAMENDELRSLFASVEPLRDGGGNVVGAIGAATDITETKRVEQELARALGFRDRMISILGHDLRNPLSAVTGLAGLVLLDDGLSPAVRAHVEHIAEAARRMMEMIRTLLDFAQSRFKEGLPVMLAPNDLGQIVATAVADLRAAHPGSVIELEAPPRVPGRWDAGRMAQVVSNLVGNALVHGEGGTPVRVALALADDHVVLRVTNNGQMIPRELVPTLFEPFRQGAAVDAATPPKGLGLGLYIVDQIVRGHRGTISVDSTPDGTTFCVRVPRGD